MSDEREQNSESTLEMYIEPSRLVVGGAVIVSRLRTGCTPGDILDAIADAVQIPRSEYRRHVLGVLDGVDLGDLGRSWVTDDS